MNVKCKSNIKIAFVSMMMALVTFCPVAVYHEMSACMNIFNLWKSVNTIRTNMISNYAPSICILKYLISYVIIVRLINLCNRIIDCEPYTLQILQLYSITIELHKLNKLTFCLLEIIHFCAIVVLYRSSQHPSLMQIIIIENIDIERTELHFFFVWDICVRLHLLHAE